MVEMSSSFQAHMEKLLADALSRGDASNGEFRHAIYAAAQRAITQTADKTGVSDEQLASQQQMLQAAIIDSEARFSPLTSALAGEDGYQSPAPNIGDGRLEQGKTQSRSARSWPILAAVAGAVLLCGAALAYFVFLDSPDEQVAAKSNSQIAQQDANLEVVTPEPTLPKAPVAPPKEVNNFDIAVGERWVKKGKAETTATGGLWVIRDNSDQEYESQNIFAFNITEPNGMMFQANIKPVNEFSGFSQVQLVTTDLDGNSKNHIVVINPSNGKVAPRGDFVAEPFSMDVNADGFYTLQIPVNEPQENTSATIIIRPILPKENTGELRFGKISLTSR